MEIRYFPHFILLIISNIFTATCQEKGSLIYVIDNTRSMRHDIEQVKESADAITKIVFEEKASQIKNMILVTFNDPHAKLVIDTESREEFKRHINNITVSNPYGNWDCEEPSLKGLLMGLERSRPGSLIYAFTDASAKDFWKSREIKNLCQKKQSQITFVLTGHCYGRLDKAFQVYYDIATACSGLAFYVSKQDVDKVLATIKESVSGNKTVITAVKAPPGKYTNIPFVIDDQTEYAIITASGSFVSLSVMGPSAVQEKVMWIRNAKVIKLRNPTPGKYIARVRGQTETSVYIVGRTDFLFNHGFSALQPKSISDTTPQPIANAETHLLIAVTDPKHTVNIISAQVLDMDENVRNDLPLRKVSKDFYTTGPFIAPSKRFKVAVTGKAVRDSKVIKRIAKIPITPQDPPKPKSKKPVVTISEGNTVEVEYGSTVKLTCKVSAYPEPKITWKSSNGTTLISQNSAFELPYEYISYVTIKDVLKHETYTCWGNNVKGTDSKKVEVIVKEPFKVKNTVKGTTKFKYNEKATLSCDITASLPMHIIWTYEDKKTSKNISKSDKYQLSEDGKQLNINKMDLDMVGKYSCKALLDRDPKKFVVFSTQVEISGLMQPKITGQLNKTTAKGSNVVITCRITGVPKPTITWQFKAEGESKFVTIPGSDDVLSVSNVNEKHAGSYKCIAHNVVGDAEHITTLTVQVLPTITGAPVETKSQKGSNVAFECNVSGIPKPTIAWQFMAKNDTKFVPISGSGNVLRVSNIGEQHAGRYKCVASNVLGTSDHVTTLTVHVSPTVTGNDAKSARKGSNIVIDCNVYGIPKPTITWQFKAKGDSKFVTIPGSDDVLRISIVDEKHAGSYKCVALNTLGDAEHITMLTVQVPPTVTGNAAKTARKGSEAVIDCNVYGIPKPTITWQFKAEGDSKFVTIPGSDDVLRISIVDEKHAGSYKCVAHNVLGDAEHITMLTVQVPPTVSGVPAKIINKGSNIDIECQVSGIPQPTISWQFLAKGGGKFVSIPGSDNVLHISNVEEKHAGRYKCVANNLLGTVELVTTLVVQMPPTVSGFPAKIINKGSNIDIECQVSGIPQPTISWQFLAKDGRKFVSIPGSENVLHISNVEEKHAGRYKCVANNLLGTAELVSTLVVQTPPKINGVSTETKPKGSNVDIKCDISGVPRPAVKWQFMAEGASNFVSIPGSNNVLHISNVDETQAGRYKCVANNVVGVAEHTITLTVQVPPKVIDVPAETISQKGSNVIINCHATGMPKPTISWQFKAEGNSKFLTIPGSDDVLRISKVDEKHAGSYKCIAHNVLGDVEHVTKLNVQVAPKVTGVAAQTTNKGSNVFIKCNVSGAPQPTITWQFMSEHGTSFVPIAGSDKMLTLSNVDEKDAGRYKCVAHNTVGDAEHITSLTVQVPPKFSNIATETTHRKGSSVDIKCTVTGSPKPTIIWQFKAEGDSKFVTIPGSDDVLRISRVDEKHAGSYKCVAHNVLGDVEHVTKLTVEVRPKILSSTSIIYESVEGRDSRLKIPCTTTGLPKPIIIWKVNGAIISQNAKYSFEDGALLIKNPTVSDSQTYTCEAISYVGSDTATFQAKVYLAPKVTGVAAQTTNKGSNAFIECNVSGAPQPTITWQFMSEHGTSFVPIAGSDKVLTLSNVDEKDAGRYKCVAHNTVGDAEHITSLTVQVPPKFFNIATETTHRKGSSVDIKCTVTGSPKPTITWQFKAEGDSKFVTILISDDVLRISIVDEKHAGSYKCVAHNVLGDVEHVTKLTVEVRPKILSSTSIVYESVEGRDSRLKIPCTTTGLPKPIIIWKVNGAIISQNEKYSIEDGALLIKNPTVSDSQSYTCEATSYVGSDKATFQAKVYQVPKVSSGAITQKVIKGSPVTIECAIDDGIPKPTITWQFMGIHDTKFVPLSQTDYTMRLWNIDVQHSGQYKCVARNVAGVAEHVTILIVEEAPEVTGIGEMVVHAGASVDIECKVIKGIPPPSITWQFKGKRESNFNPMPGSEKVLHISGVQKMYTGSYKCIAHNTVGTAEHITTLNVEYAPIIMSKSNITYEGLEGDVALRIPCNVVGQPKPTITWKIAGAEVIPNDRISIIDGSLVIKEPTESDTNSYTCEAKNYLGSVKKTFTTEIHTVLGDPDKIKEVNILIGTSKKLECGSNDPAQKVRWFKELEEMTTKTKYIYLKNVDFYTTGNYSCRVSDMNGAHTINYEVIVGTKPVFTFDQEDPVFDWQGSDSENDLLDCQADAIPPADVVWTYNGKVLEGKNTSYLFVDGNWGPYSCNASNLHGAIQKSFDVISSYCFVKRKPTDGHIMPLILSEDFTWPVLNSRENYLAFEPGLSVTFICPNQNGTKNSFKILPTMNEISARCDKQDIFIVNDKPYKVSDLHCSNEIEAIVTNTHEKCLTDTSELIRVGYDVHGFLQTYEVCFDTSKDIPLYTRVMMFMTNQGREVTQSWYKYPGIGTGKSEEVYTCVDAKASCCYSKRQLVNARDVSDGPAQRSTYIDPLNAIPYWRSCEDVEDPWDNIESMIRMQFGGYSEFAAWTGIHTLQEKNGLTIPRYLWKVVKFDKDDSIAIVHVNDESFSDKDILCKNICIDDNVPWIRELDKRTYCCNVDDFLKSFGLHHTNIGEASTYPLIDVRTVER